MTQKQDEADKIQQAIFEREVEEQLQKERLTNFWNKYRFAIIGAIAGVILVTVGTEVYYAWRTKVRLNESNIFENAVLLSYTGDSDKALSELNGLVDSAKTGYKYLAQLKIAGILFGTNREDEALAALKAVMDDTGAPQQLRDIATLSYVGHQVDAGDTERLKALLTPMLTPVSAFYGSAVELAVTLAVVGGEAKTALPMLKQAISEPSIGAATKTRLEQLLSVIENDA